MPYSNPITQNELTDLALYNPLHPRDGSPNELYMPQAYFLVPPATQAGPVKWRLFDAAYITTGIIDPNRLGTGSTGAGNLYLADDGTWKPVSGGGGVGTLDQVTDLGNVTTNTIDVGGVKSDYFLLDTTATPTLQPGMFGWNDAYGTADLRLKGNNVTLQLGQEILARVVNKTGADLLESDYKVVRVRVASEGGAQGQRLAVVLAQGDNDPDSATTLGVVTETILNNQEGFITILGNVNNINTTGSLQGETWVDGDVLYLSPTTPGGLTKVKPQAPQHTLIVGYVVYAHNNQGKIFVKVDNGYELDELHNVLITSPASGQLLRYNGSVWQNWTPNFLTTVPTLAQVTTAGNTTTNAITVGGLAAIGSTNTAGIVNITNNFSGTYPNAVNILFPNISSSSVQAAGFYIGKALSVNNGWGVNYIHSADGSSSNRGSIAFYGTDNIINWFANGNVTINSTINAGYKLDVNGTARVSGNLTVDTNTLFVDAANDRVGIGTTTPEVQLHVLSSSNPIFIVENAGAQWLRFSAGAVGSAMKFSNTGNFAIGPVATKTDINLINTFVVFGSTGNIGINTTTDAGYRLDVNGTMRIQGATFDFINTAAVFKLGYNTTKFTTFESFPDGATRVRVNGITKFFIGADPLSGLEIPYLYSIAFVNPGIATYSHINWSLTNNQFEFKNGTQTAFVDIAVGKIKGVLTNATHTNQVYYNTTTGELTYGALPTPATPTLDAVTTAGNTTANGIVVGLSSIDTLTVGRGAGAVASNTVLGFQALNNNFSGSNNVAVGYYALHSNTTGRGVAIGRDTLYSNTTGRHNIGIGESALYSNTTGWDNMGIGRETLVSATDGFNNVAIGNYALSSLINGNYNVAIGTQSLQNTTGSDNIAIGELAGQSNLSGSNNIFIGKGTNGVSTTESNRTWIGTSTTTSTWLAGNVLIGTTTNAGYKLYVNGAVKATGRVQAAYFDSIDENPSFLLWKSDFSQVWGSFTTRSGTGGFAGIYDPTISASAGLGIYFMVDATTTAAFINSSGNFGIGTVSPSTKLHVNGVITATGGTSTDWNTAYSWGNHATAGYLTSQPWVVSGSNIYYNTGGSVGIGTTTPSHKLEVVGTSFIQAQIRSTDSAAGIKLVPSAGHNYEIQATNDNKFLIYNRSTGTFSFTIDSAHNVGIGTLNPGYKLDVVGNSRVQSLRVETNYPLIEIRNTTGPAVVGYVTTRQALIGGSFGNGELTLSSQGSAMPFYVSSTNKLKFELTDYLNTYSWNRTAILRDVYPSLIFNSNDTKWAGIAYDYTGGMALWVNAPSVDVSAVNPAMYITNSGSVGIGTSSPNLGKLHVEGTVYSTRYELMQNGDLASGDKGLRVQDNFGGTYQYNNSGPYTGHFTAYHIRNTSAATMFYATSAAFGIGTTTPAYRLHVSGGNVMINNGGGGNIYGFDEYHYIKLRDGGNWITLGDYGGIRFYTGNNSTTLTEKVQIAPNGNVGIGTTSPSSLLQIGSGQTTTNPLLRLGVIYDTSRSVTGAIAWNDVANITGKIHTEYDGTMVSMVFGSLYNSAYNSNNLMIIRGNGNVGIGTLSPSYTLDVNGTGRFTGILRADNAIDSYGSVASHRLFTGSSVFAGGIGLSSWTGRGGSDVDIYSVANIAFQTNNTNVPKMYINSTGNIGIATTSPNSKLHIFGGTQNWNETIPGQTVGTIHLAPNSNNSDFGNAITFGAIDWNSGGDAQAGIYVKASGAYGTKMYFATTNSFATGSRTRMMINNDGKVAINTTVPAGVLTVNVGNGGVNGTSGVTVYGTGNYLSLEMGIEGGYDGMIRTYGNDLLLYGGHWRTIGTVASEDHSIKFFTTKNGSANWSTAKMILNHNGNLGIGTTNPTYKLQVNGTGGVAIADGGAQLDIVPANYFIGPILSGNGVSISPEGSDRHLRLLTSTSGAASKISIGYFKAGPGWYAALHVDSSETNPPLLLQAQGNNVVIGGTVDSGDKLNVIGTVAATGYKINGNTGWSGTIFIPSNPPGQQNITVEGGLITNFGA